MKVQTRTDKHEYGGKTVYRNLTKETLRIEERLSYNAEGKLTEFWVQYSDETFRKPSEKRPGEWIDYRDEVTYSFQTKDHWSMGETRERCGWSTGWMDDLEGKQKEAVNRQNALKYFAKRKKQLNLEG